MIEPRQLDEAIAASHLAYRPYERKKLRFILNAIDQFTRDRGRELAEVSILEIGCGQGGVALPIARLGCRITAFDVDADEVAVLNSRASLTIFRTGWRAGVTLCLSSLSSS